MKEVRKRNAKNELEGLLIGSINLQAIRYLSTSLCDFFVFFNKNETFSFLLVYLILICYSFSCLLGGGWDFGVDSLVLLSKAMLLWG